MHSYSYVYAVETFFTSTPNKGHNRKNSILITNQNFGPDRCHPVLHFKPLKKDNPYNSAKVVKDIKMSAQERFHGIDYVAMYMHKHTVYCKSFTMEKFRGFHGLIGKGETFPVK